MRFGITNYRSLPFFAILFFAAFFLQNNLSAQETWSLQRCIEYARTNSLSLKQAGYSVALASLIEKQNKLNRLPNASANTSAGYQFGRTIDPTTNSFNNQTIAFNSMSLSVGVNLFTGGFISNSIKQSNLDVKASEQDAATAFNNLALSVANAYLNILMSEEQLENANRRKKLSQDQLGQTEKLISAGSIPANDRLDVLAQMANDEQAIVQAQNSVELNYLTLKNLMQIDPTTDLKVERPAYTIPTDANPFGTTLNEVYNTAVNTQPQIQAAELRKQSAAYDVNIAKSGYYPTLSLFGGLDSRWSDASKLAQVDKFTTRVDNIFFVDTDALGLGQGVVALPVGIDVEDANITYNKYPYFDQIRDNFGQNIGVSLRIPIYSNGTNDINVQRAQVGILNAQVESDLAKQQLKNDVQSAIASARAGQLTLQASEKAAEAGRVAYENAEKRFKLGTINNLQLLTARNTYDIAQGNLTVAKYDYLFRLKIIDFYLGRPIKLD